MDGKVKWNGDVNGDVNVNTNEVMNGNSNVNMNGNSNGNANVNVNVPVGILVNGNNEPANETTSVITRNLLREHSNNLRVTNAIREINKLNFMSDHHKLYITGLEQIVHSTPDIPVYEYLQIFEELETIISWGNQYNTFDDDVNEIISILKHYISHHDHKPDIDPSSDPENESSFYPASNPFNDPSNESAFEPIPTFDFGFINESYIRADEIYFKWIKCDLMMNTRLYNLRCDLKVLSRKPSENSTEITKRHGRYKGISYIKYLIDVLTGCCRKVRTWIRAEYELAEETIKRMEATERHLYNMYREAFG